LELTDNRVEDFFRCGPINTRVKNLSTIKIQPDPADSLNLNRTDRSSVLSKNLLIPQASAENVPRRLGSYLPSPISTYNIPYRYAVNLKEEITYLV